MMEQKEKIKYVRDHIVPILVGQARLEMTRLYKLGVVEPIGDATVGIFISTEPIRSILGFTQTDFYALYKILILLKPLIPVSASARELLQEHVQTKIHAIHGNLRRSLKGEGTLVIYSIDFWVTKDGEVWHEEEENLWRKILELPQGLQLCYLNLKADLHVKYVV